MKKSSRILLILTILLSLAIFTSCSEKETETGELSEDVETEEIATDEEKIDTEEGTTETNVNTVIPTINYGYMFSNHQAPLIIAAAKNEEFKDDGVYLKEVLPKEAYVIMDGDKEVANLNLVVGENGGELMTLMNQDRLDMAFGSVGLPLTNIDKGSDMKVLAPIHVDGIGLVMLPDAEPTNFDTFVDYVKAAEEPIIIGYHSPQNAPVILFTTAMEEAGYAVTEDATDMEADIQLVNLKGTGNLIPSLQNREVDAFIGPSPFPELAEVNGTGKVIVDLKDLPPEGKWENFPCCVMIAADKAIEKYPEEIAVLYEIISNASDYANTEKEDAAVIISDWMGVDLEAAKRTGTKYTTDPTETWYNNFNVTFENLQKDGKFEGELKDVTLEEVHDDVFNLDMAQEYHGE